MTNMTNITRQDIMNLTAEHLNKMNKAELQETLERAIEILNYSSHRNDGDSRKTQVIQLLLEKPTSIYDMTQALDVTNKNISSILNSLKKLGIFVGTNSRGEKVLENPEKAQEFLDNPEAFRVITD